MDKTEILESLQSSISNILAENKALKFENELYKTQLIIVAMNGLNKGLEYQDLTKIDFSKIRLAIGNSSFDVLNPNNKIITNFKELEQ